MNMLIININLIHSSPFLLRAFIFPCFYFSGLLLSWDETLQTGECVQGFDLYHINLHISLVPFFVRLGAPKGIAAALDWPEGVWAILMHCKLMRIAQEACSSVCQR